MTARRVPWSADFAAWEASARGRTRIVWPAEEPPTDGRLALHVEVTDVLDQSRLHRALCREGYVPELMFSTGVRDYWRFVHPDGEQP